MSVRIVMTKQTASGEQIQIDIPSWNPVTGAVEHTSVDEMSQVFDDVMKTVDMRSQEMHMRMLEAYNMRDYCTPEIWSKLVDLLDILSGKQSIDTVQRRWVSSIEETEALEQARQEAYNQSLLEEANRTNGIYDGKDY